MDQTSISERNRTVAISRWSNVSKTVNKHLLSIRKLKSYTLHKARLMGFLAGDGGVYIRREKSNNKVTHHDIQFHPDHPSLVHCFIESFKYLYLKEPKVKRLNNYFAVRVSSKVACQDLLSVGKFGTHEWKIPLNFLSTKEAKKEWLRAFFDCEGYVGERQIQIQSVNGSGLRSVMMLLKRLGIESRWYEYERKEDNWNTNYIISITKKSQRRRFFKEIGFNHSEKMKKLSIQFDASVPESG